MRKIDRVADLCEGEHGLFYENDYYISKNEGIYYVRDSKNNHYLMRTVDEVQELIDKHYENDFINYLNGFTKPELIKYILNREL